MSKLLTVLIGIIIIAALVYLVNVWIPGIPQFIRWIADVVILIIAVIWGAKLLGVNTE